MNPEEENNEDLTSSEVDSSPLDLDGDMGFAAIMDTLAPDALGEIIGEESDDPASSPDVTGLPPGSAQEPAGTGQTPSAQGDGNAGELPLADTTGAAGAVDAATIAPKWGEISTALTNRQQKELESESINEVRAERENYFNALQRHPRELVGLEVPSINGEGMEVLSDSQDAKDWQDAVKQSLNREIRDKVSRKSDDLKPMMETLSSSINLFQNNPDIIPGTKQFDKELADKFAELMSPYKQVLDGKLIGYTVPVQPHLDLLRSTLKRGRAAAPAAPTPRQQQAAAQSRAATGQFINGGDAPQAGLSSQAGQSGAEAEDFSTLFGTIGLPTLKI